MERWTLMADGYAANAGLLEEGRVRGVMTDLVDLIDMDLIDLHVHEVGPDVPSGPGHSLVGVITTSHVTLHTWPEVDGFMLDVVSCKPFSPEDALQHVRHCFEVRRWERIMSWPRPVNLMEL